MPGQWEQRQFLVRCPNNSAPRLHIYLPVNEKKPSRSERGGAQIWAGKFQFSATFDEQACVRVWYPRPPPRFLLIVIKKFALKAQGERAAVTLEEFWWCRPSVWIVECVWEGSKCTSADMLFVEKGASPLTPFSQQLIGSAWVSFRVFSSPSSVCVCREEVPHCHRCS